MYKKYMKTHLKVVGCITFSSIHTNTLFIETCLWTFSIAHLLTIPDFHGSSRISDFCPGHPGSCCISRDFCQAIAPHTCHVIILCMRTQRYYCKLAVFIRLRMWKLNIQPDLLRTFVNGTIQQFYKIPSSKPFQFA